MKANHQRLAQEWLDKCKNHDTIWATSTELMGESVGEYEYIIWELINAAQNRLDVIIKEDITNV